MLQKYKLAYEVLVGQAYYRWICAVTSDDLRRDDGARFCNESLMPWIIDTERCGSYLVWAGVWVIHFLLAPVRFLCRHRNVASRRY